MTVYLMSTSAAVTHQVRFLNFIKSKNFNKAAFIMYYQATKIISIIIIRCMTNLELRITVNDAPRHQNRQQSQDIQYQVSSRCLDNYQNDFEQNRQGQRNKQQLCQSEKKKSSSAYEKTFNQDLKNMANDSKYCKHIWSVTGIDPQNDVSKDFRESGEFKREKIEKIT